jgi:methylated-DNA-[protein]-cysteine S-methyltransferase
VERKRVKTYRITVASPTGPLTLIADETHLLACGWNYAPAPEESSPLLERTKLQLGEYFDGQRSAFELPLRPEGTAFQKKVWRALQEIPYGETRSYGEVAKRVGCKCARAIGTANGKNPIAIIIPCHGANGSLTGFGGGLPAKRVLLAREGKLA